MPPSVLAMQCLLNLPLPSLLVVEWGKVAVDGVGEVLLLHPLDHLIAEIFSIHLALLQQVLKLGVVVFPLLRP